MIDMPYLSINVWPFVVLAAVLILAAVTDVRWGKIHNVVTYTAIAIGLVGHTILGGWGGREHSPLGLAGALAGLAAGFLPMYLAWRAGCFGGGNVKLMAAVGALAGWRFALAGMFYGLAAAAVMAIVVMVRRRIVKRTLLRVWRVLFLAMARTAPADPATAESPKIPFGLALCIGCVAAGVEFFIRSGHEELFLFGL